MGSSTLSPALLLPLLQFGFQMLALHADPEPGGKSPACTVAAFGKMAGEYKAQVPETDTDRAGVSQWPEERQGYE